MIPIPTVYRAETGGEFTDREEAEHIAYELNKEGVEINDQ